MVRHISFIFAISFVTLSLISCATVQQQVKIETPEIEPAGWVVEQKTRQQIQSWEIRGRLGVQTKNEGGSLDIVWKQAQQDFSIHLIAPLGAGSYRVQGDNHGAQIRHPDGTQETVSNIDEVFSSMLGVQLPVNAVKDWIRGLPAESMVIDDIGWNEQGLLKTVKQAGWNVEMKKYIGKKILLPHRLYLSRDDDDDLAIRLILRQWLIDSELTAGQ